MRIKADDAKAFRSHEPDRAAPKNHLQVYAKQAVSEPFCWNGFGISNRPFGEELAESRMKGSTTAAARKAAKRGPLTRQLMDQNAMLRGLGDAVASKILNHGELVSLSLREQIYLLLRRIRSEGTTRDTSWGELRNREYDERRT